MKDDDAASIERIDAVLYGRHGEDGFFGRTRDEIKQLFQEVRDVEGRITAVAQMFTRDSAEIVSKIDRGGAEVTAGLVALRGEIESLKKCSGTLEMRVQAMETAAIESEKASRLSRDATRRVLIGSLISSGTAIMTALLLFFRG